MSKYEVEKATRKWTIVLRYKNIERVYKVETKTRYSAIKEALKAFIEELNLPGTPTEYFNAGLREREIEIESRSEIDRRRANW